MRPPRDFDDFWPIYLSHHRHLETRLGHFIGTGFAVICLLLGIIRMAWAYWMAALVVAYVVSWVSHAWIEHQPSYLRERPIWAMRADLMLCLLMLQRGLSADFKALASVSWKNPPR